MSGQPQIEVRCLSAAVDDLSKTGSVAAVVRMAKPGLVYLETQQLVVAVEHRSAPRAPNGIYVDDAVDLAVVPVGGGALLADGQLRLGSQRLVWTAETPVFDGAVAELPASPGAFSPALFEALGRSPGTGCPVCCLIDDNSLWERPPVRTALHAVALRDRTAALSATDLNLLLGLGRGLTPETDDLLCGALSAQYAQGIVVDDALAVAALTERGAATTALSGTWLRLAASGRTMDPLLDVLGVPAGSVDWRAAVRVLLGIGSTTGRSLLVGVTLGLTGQASRTVIARCRWSA